MNSVWQKYFTKGILDKPSPVSLVFPRKALKKNSSQFIALTEYYHQELNDGVNGINVSFDAVDQHHEKLNPIIRYLQTELNDYLIGAYSHGSFGTNEVVDYSDFDGLLVVKKEVFSSSRLLQDFGKKVLKGNSLLIDIDPLQHHGWFVVSEEQLRNWPVNYLPIEVLKRSSLLLGQKELKIKYNDLDKSSKAIASLCNSILRNLEKEDFPKNYYELKSALSQFMLIPTLYYQFKQGKGIFKKESFELVKSSFSKNDWQIMNDVSEWRLNWSYSKSPFIKSLIFNKYFSQSLSSLDRRKWNQSYRLPMLKFVRLIQEDIKP